MAKTKENPVVSSDAYNQLPAFSGKLIAKAVVKEEAEAARKRSAQWLATARGGLADQLRIVADQMIALAANPVINTLTEDGINAVTEAMDAFCLLKEEIEAAN